MALGSIVYSAFTAIKPSQNKVYIAYFLIISAVVSGAVLALLSHTPIGKVCLSGAVFFVVILPLLTIARKRLATAR